MPNRRIATKLALLGAVGALASKARSVEAGTHPNQAWIEAAFRMRELAESWRDQSYGAVLVLGNQLVGEGPSRVVKDKNPEAHAERVAIADAQRRLGKQSLEGAVLYSTSRPCAACEAAAAKAQVTRMYFGHGLQDAGKPALAAR